MSEREALLHYFEIGYLKEDLVLVLINRVVGSVASGDDDYCETLKGPMYVRIREGLDSRDKHKIASVCMEEEKHKGSFTEHRTVETAVENPPAMHNTLVTEIVEVESEHCPHSEGSPSTIGSPIGAITDQKNIIQKWSFISPEVEYALDLLDRAMAIIRGAGSCNTQSDCSLVDQELPTLDPTAEASCLSGEAPPKITDMDKPSDEDECRSPTGGFRHNGEDSLLKERLPASDKTEIGTLNCSHDKLIGADKTPIQPAFFDSVKVCDEQSLEIYSGTDKPNRKKKHRRCC